MSRREGTMLENTSLEDLNKQIESRIAHMKHSGLSEDEKKVELRRISKLINFRDMIDMKKRVKESTEYPGRMRGLKDDIPMNKDELYVLIDSV